MTIRSPYQTHAVTSPWWGERPPRGYTRTDRVDINLFDGGHGNPDITQNPILLGLGATLKLRLNQYVRSWKVFVREGTDPEIEVTDQFTKVVDRMYELQGVIGAGAFNPSSRASGDWGSPVQLHYRVETTNITLTAEFNATLIIQSSDDIRSCPDACQLDFNLMRELHKLRIRLWRDVIDPGRQPRDVQTNTGALIYLFDQAEQLKGLRDELCQCYNYFDQVMIGVKFFIVGDCETAALAQPPGAPDCNPWDQITLPQFVGEDIILPIGWENSGC